MTKRRNVVLGDKILELIEQKKQPKSLISDDGLSYLWDEDEQTYIIEGTSIGITAYDLATGTFTYEAPILDSAEKRYLKAVIRPFRDRVMFIRKVNPTHGGQEYIEIYIGYSDAKAAIGAILTFPEFDAGTMYGCMKLGKDYTLAELEL